MPLKNFFKVILPFGLLAILVWNVVSGWEGVRPYLTTFQVSPFIGSFVVLLFIYPESSVAWYILVRRMGISITLRRAMYVWVISNTSRYIPGSIWQYIGRVGLGQEAGIKRGQGVMSVLAEVFFVITAGIIVSLLTLPYWNILGVQPKLWGLLILLSFLLFHPSISSWVIGLAARMAKRDFGEFKNKLSVADSVFVLPWFILSFVLNGIALFFLVGSLGVNVGLESLITFSGFYALSWIVGYFTLFAPAGIGATEASLAYLLSFNMPISLASTIALTYRFLITVAEMAVFAIVVKTKR